MEVTHRSDSRNTLSPEYGLELVVITIILTSHISRGLADVIGVIRRIHTPRTLDSNQNTRAGITEDWREARLAIRD